MNLLLIGAGQLGSRHLQSCLKYSKDINIYVVDNSEASIILAKTRALEIKKNANHNIFFLKNMSMIRENSFDYLIIATAANSRFKVLAEALKLFSVKYAILEKILFQDLQSYQESLKLINDNKVTAFVNCPLRAYPFFKEIKEKYISHSNKTSVTYVGGEWVGLGCNSIHYLDLLNFLSDEKLQTINLDGLDNGYIESKRMGNVEFTGTIEASYESGSYLSIQAIEGSQKDSTIEILNGHHRVIIDELTGDYNVFENDELLVSGSYEVVYQSDLTHLMIKEIEESGICSLISFDQSLELHQPLISKLLFHFNKFSDTKTLILPIT